MRDLGRFPAKMASKTDNELREIAESTSFVEEARLAAIEELKKRGNHDLTETKRTVEQEIEKQEERVQERRKIWVLLPKELKIVITLLWISTFIGAGITVLINTGLVDYPFREKGQTQVFGIGLVLALIFTFGITGLFVLGFERRLNWVRWVYVVLVALSVPFVLLSALFTEFYILDLLSYLARTLDISAVIYLFRPGVNTWFTGDRKVYRDDLLDDIND